MHGPAVVARALSLRSEGLGPRRIAQLTGVPVSTVRDWVAGALPSHSRAALPSAGLSPACDRCGHEAHRFDDLPAAYLYLLGLYLGDGCISAHPRGVYRLRIFLDLRYPGIVNECGAAMAEVRPGNRVHRLLRTSNYSGCPDPSNVEISSFSKSWPCLFPQHGPGKKHQRPISLTGWQRELVTRTPQLLVRGLLHSDGCRFINTGRGGWSCPRYAFDNLSSDIRGIFCAACDELGLHWTESRPTTIYVSRRDDVARVDEFVGPKR